MNWLKGKKEQMGCTLYLLRANEHKFTFMSFREIDDVLWNSIEPYLPPQKSYTGRPRADMRKLMNGICTLL